jgi:hypothetical protein
MNLRSDLSQQHFYIVLSYLINNIIYAQPLGFGQRTKKERRGERGWFPKGFISR